MDLKTYEPEIKKMQSQQRIDIAVQAIISELNGGDAKEVGQYILDSLDHTHRSLQQYFWDAILKAQLDYAEVAHDLRNEGAVRLAKVVKEAAKKHNLDYGLPRI